LISTPSDDTGEHFGVSVNPLPSQDASTRDIEVTYWYQHCLIASNNIRSSARVGGINHCEKVLKGTYIKEVSNTITSGVCPTATSVSICRVPNDGVTNNLTTAPMMK
jgi:hypothetical protein